MDFVVPSADVRKATVKKFRLPDGERFGGAMGTQGQVVTGTVVRCFETKFEDGSTGECYVVQLPKAMVVDGAGLCPQVSIGGMTGFRMALQAAGLSDLQQGDRVVVKATGVEDSAKPGYSPMTLFEVTVERGEKSYHGKTQDAKAPFLNAKFWNAGMLK